MTIGRPAMMVCALAAALFGASAAHGADEPAASAGKRAWSLSDCVNSALDSNRGLMAAAQGIERAGGAYQQARSAVLPQVSASAQAFRSRTGERSQLVGGELIPFGENRYDEVNASLSARQSVIDVASWKAISSARANESAAEYAYRTSQEELVLLVQQSYYNYLKATRLLEVAEENVKVGEEQLKLAEKRLEVGAGVSADVLKARAQTATDRLAVIDAKKNVDIARQTLCHVTGLPLDAGVVVEDVQLDQVAASPPQIDVDATLADLPDLDNQRRAVEAARHTAGAAKAAMLPTVGVQFNYQRQLRGINTSEITTNAGAVIEEESKTDPYGSWFAAAQVDLPLFTGGNTRGRINQARANLRASEENLAEAERAARLEIETAKRNVEAAAEAISVSREGTAAAEEDNRLSQGFYTHGLVPILNLVESQAALVEAKTNAVNAIYDYWIALASLDRAMGRGLARFSK
ncbi:MAG: TolC family protein [bacterium]